MALQAQYDNLDEVPEAHRELYTERNGRFEFTGVEGVKTQADIDRLTTSLTKERDTHKATKAQISAWAALGGTPEEIQQKLDRIAELEAAAEGKLDEGKLNQLVEGRIKSKTAPIERERDGLKGQLAEANAKIEQYEARERQRSIHDAVRTAATKHKLLDTAVEDALFLAERMFEVDEEGRVVTRDGVGVTPGVEAHVWLTEMQQKRPHWWGPSQGGGGRPGTGGGGGANPFTAAGWNMTEQGRLVRENPDRANQLARAAGTTIGGPKPAAA